MDNHPFIIKNKVMETVVPVDSDLYDENQESRIQIVQAINGYLTVTSIFYEDQYVLREFQAHVVLLAF